MEEGIRKTTMGSMAAVTEMQNPTRKHRLPLEVMVDKTEIKILVNKIWTLSHLNFSVSYAYFS
jgi:hypothetical protein